MRSAGWQPTWPPSWSTSLNRLVLGDLPGLPEGMAGHRVNEWLLATAMPRYSTDVLGTVLGAMVGTLHLAPPDARAARPEWPDAHWDRWRRVERLALGGGLFAGPLGPPMLDTARQRLADWGVEVQVDVAPDPIRLTLRGAASLLPPSGGVALDCGGTTTKRALVGSGGRPVVMSPAPTLAGGSAPAVVAAIAAAAAPLVRAAVAAQTDSPLTVVVAIATYVDDTGQPYAGQLGPYAPLGDVDLVQRLRTSWSEDAGRPVVVHVVHDGAAALAGARADDPAYDAAIVIGTAVGSGLGT